MEHGIDSIKLAVGIIIVCVVVALAFFVTRTGKNQVNQATAQLVDVTSQYDEPSKQVYDGIMADGKEVIETINKFATDNTTAVKVYHKNGKVDVYNGNEAATAALTGTGTAGDPYLSDKYVAIGDPALWSRVLPQNCPAYTILSSLELMLNTSIRVLLTRALSFVTPTT